MTDSTYLIALGGNVRHPRFGMPRRVLERAYEHLQLAGAEMLAQSAIIRSRPIGPSQREYANAAALIRYDHDPVSTLGMLQQIEQMFGRRRRGQRWGARVLDLDIVMWSGGRYDHPELQIPHPEFRGRPFVTSPASEIAGEWVDPQSNLSLHQLNARLTRARGLTS